VPSRPLRHTYASLLIDAGVHPKALQVQLGHANAAETIDTYGHLYPDTDQGTRTAIAPSAATLYSPCNRARYSTAGWWPRAAARRMARIAVPQSPTSRNSRASAMIANGSSWASTGSIQASADA